VKNLALNSWKVKQYRADLHIIDIPVEITQVKLYAGVKSAVPGCPKKKSHRLYGETHPNGAYRKLE